jgi:hypothetical protein
MKHLIVFLVCILYSATYLHAQQLEDYNFIGGHGGMSTISGSCPFFTPTNLPNWLNTGGTPEFTCCSGGHGTIFFLAGPMEEGGYGYESVAANYNFENGHTYVIRIGIASANGGGSGCNNKIMVLATNSIPEISGALLNCQNALPSLTGSQTIGEYITTTDVSNKLYTVVFQPTANYNQIFFYGQGCSAAHNYNVRLDSVSISSCVNGEIDYTESGQIAGGIISDFANITAGSGSSSSDIVDVDPGNITEFLGEQINLDPSFLAQMKNGEFFLATPITKCDVSCGKISGPDCLNLGTTATFSITGGMPGGIWTSSNTSELTINPLTGAAHAVGITDPSTGVGVTVTYTAGECVVTELILIARKCGGDSRLASPDDTIESVNNVNRSEISVYPNPTANSISISYPCSSAGPLKIKLSDVAGRILYTETADCSENDNVEKTIDISSFAPGIYFVDLTLNDQHILKKIVKL